MSIHISTMSGKLKDIRAISTNSLINETCNARKDIDGSVCQKCFAGRTLKCRKALNDRTIDNSYLLSERVLEISELPKISDDIFRLECFGDIINEYHAINYINLCYSNPDTTFSLFTKNIGTLGRAIDRIGGKPENLIVVQGSLMLNRYDELYPYADKLFTVFTKDYIKEHRVTINCGAKSCRGCMLCYTKNDVKYINEILKLRGRDIYNLSAMHINSTNIYTVSHTQGYSILIN